METIDEILEELRSGEFAPLADRIEAALKQAVTNCNQLKAREALKYLRDASREFCHLIRNSKYIGLMDEYKYAEVARIRDAIANASLTLAAPARNCDLIADADEAKKAIHGQYPLYIRPKDERDAVIEWLFAKAGGGEKDG